MRAKLLVPLVLAALLLPPAALPAGSADRCFGRAPTIRAVAGVTTLGTAGDDVIVGTAGNDTIRGLGGADRICGRGGNDVLEGGAGQDRIDGGAGRDVLIGGAGTGNVLVGGTGADTLIASGPSDKVRGGRGADDIDALGADFSLVRGGAGNDTIRSGYRSDLDGGPGTDRCSLGLGVAGTNCETVELLCGRGGAPPMFWQIVPNLTTATADFDGDGRTDTLYVWGILNSWRAQIETDGGFGARVTLPTRAPAIAEAIGGYDVNGDGVAEAFIKVAAGAHTRTVGLYTLFEPVGSPTTGLSCGLQAVTFAGVAVRAEFPIGAAPDNVNASGLLCQADGTLRVYRQALADPTHYRQERYDHPYLPGFGAASPELGASVASVLMLVSPADQATIRQAGQFTCGSLSLDRPPPDF